MRLPKLIRTSVFQLTLVYMALFAVSAIALFAFIYWSTLGYLERQTNAVIEAEIDGLAEQYERRNLRGFAEVIDGARERVTARGARSTCSRSRTALRSRATCRTGRASSKGPASGSTS